MKICKKCLIEKEFSMFYAHKLTSDGYRNECKDCIKAHNKKYHVANKERTNQRNKNYYYENIEISKKRVRDYRDKYPEKKAELDRKYRLSHPERDSKYRHKRRAMKRDNGTFLVTSKELRKMYLSSCIYCGSCESITVDHVIPLMRGGTHGIGNLAPACLSCNTSKGAKTVMEWRKARTG